LVPIAAYEIHFSYVRAAQRATTHCKASTGLPVPEEAFTFLWSTPQLCILKSPLWIQKLFQLATAVIATDFYYCFPKLSELWCSNATTSL